jgi:hypothetical protein
MFLIKVSEGGPHRRPFLGPFLGMPSDDFFKNLFLE